MPKRGFLVRAAVPVAASIVLGGAPAVADAATAAYTGSVSVPSGTGGSKVPVIVILKDQAAAGSTAAGAIPSMASQGLLLNGLRQAGARDIERFTLVNSVAATVSAVEARRLVADPEVARVIPDTAFTVSGPDLAATGAGGAARAITQAGATLSGLNDIPGACGPTGKSQLAPEGLPLTSTVSGSAKAPTARALGFTGAGVKVGYIADGIDPDNVNFKRANGTSVFTDYKDFTGNGPGAPTTGGEAFLDANTIAGQGVHVYNVNGFSAESYSGTTCDVRIQGVAPGASLVGLDVFSGDPNNTLMTTTSMIAQAINYAVETGHVNVLNESFGSNTLPDTAQDVIKLFDDAAVRAGVVVSVSSGDAGTANTIGSPASDPNVISVGATTQFQALAQANIGGSRYFATKGWLSDNISAFSSSGYDEAGGTVDMVAPGDLSWASCDASGKYSDCVNNQGKPSAIEEAGGTSEAAPFVSGAAALVIQAFRKTHGGASPTPAQVKRILLSTATDLGAPAQEQGAGLLNSYKAVQLAESYGIGKRTGMTLLSSAGQLAASASPGTAEAWKVTVANEGTKAQTVLLSSRTLNPAPASSASGSVTLSDSTSVQYRTDTGIPANYARFTFKVPAGQARLDASMAYPASPGSVTRAPYLTLFDPAGRIAADSEPQGVGNYGNAEVRAPDPGTWTGIVADDTAANGGYNGQIPWRETTQTYSSFGSVSPKSLSLSPGQAKSFTVAVTTPASPGDLAGSVLLHSARGWVTSIPVVVRSQVDVASGGGFTGTLTGGNGRGPFGTGHYYQFTVPSGTKAVRAELQLRDNPGSGNIVGAYLVTPDGNVAGYGQNTDMSGQQLGITDGTLTATALSPVAGVWTLVIAFAEPVAGTEVSDPYTGYVNFTTAGTVTPATPLPDGGALTPGTPVTIPVTITNTSNAPQDYYLDPRLNTTTTVTLAPFTDGMTGSFSTGSAQTALPIGQGTATSQYFVPSLTSSLTLRQTSSVAAMTDLSTASGGDPDVGIAGQARGSLCGTSVSESYAPSGGTVSSGLWQPAPIECGPYSAKGAPAGTATDTLTATTAGFDTTVSVVTGDFERLAQGVGAGNTGVANAVEVQAGQSTTVNVTFTGAGAAGSVDRGTLYLDALQSGVPPYDQVAGDQVASLPYSYTVG